MVKYPSRNGPEKDEGEEGEGISRQRTFRAVKLFCMIP